MSRKPWPRKAETAILRDVCIPGRHPHSYWNFVRFAMGWTYRCRVPGQKDWLTKREHRKFCDWVQWHLDDWYAKRALGDQECRYIMVWVFRSFGKSNTFTKPVAPYCMLREPDFSSYIGSETHDKAKDFLKPLKSILSGKDQYSRFTEFFGNWYNPERTWTRDTIDTGFKTSTGTSEPSIGTFGTETGITAKHPLFVNADDFLSAEKLKESSSAITQALSCLRSIRFTIPNWVNYTGTCYRDDDVIQTMLLKEGVASWNGHPPLRTYPTGAWHVYFLQARDRSDTSVYPKGRPVLPEAGLTDEKLTKDEKDDPTGFATQMMGDPAEHELKEITDAQIDTLLIDRKDVPPARWAVIHTDTAFKEEEKRHSGDRTVIAGVLHDLRSTGMVILDRLMASNADRSEDFDNKLIALLMNYKARGIRVYAITTEKEASGDKGSMYKRHLEDIIGRAGLRIPIIFQFHRAGSHKHMRIREGLTYWLEGLFRIARDCGQLPLLYEEHTRLGYAPHDDVADTLADMWAKEIWPGRPAQQLQVDFQPGVPAQPGDEILKNATLQREYADIEFELKHGRPRDPFSDDYQPADHGFRDPDYHF